MPMLGAHRTLGNKTGKLMKSMSALLAAVGDIFSEVKLILTDPPCRPRRAQRGYPSEATGE